MRADWETAFENCPPYGEGKGAYTQEDFKCMMEMERNMEALLHWLESEGSFFLDQYLSCYRQHVRRQCPVLLLPGDAPWHPGGPGRVERRARGLISASGSRPGMSGDGQRSGCPPPASPGPGSAGMAARRAAMSGSGPEEAQLLLRHGVPLGLSAQDKDGEGVGDVLVEVVGAVAAHIVGGVGLIVPHAGVPQRAPEGIVEPLRKEPSIKAAGSWVPVPLVRSTWVSSSSSTWPYSWRMV